MANNQQSSIIEWVDPNLLKVHPKNEIIYGEDGYQDLIQSISEIGVLQALYVRNDNIVISGHRRWRASISARCPLVPIIRVSYPSVIDETQAIIEHNRYRIKNGQQLYNEGIELEKIERGKAKQRMKDAPRNFVEHPCLGETADKVAQVIGLGSGDQWRKLSYIAEHKPDLLSRIKPEDYSIHKAYKEVQHEVISKPTIIPQEPEGLFSVIVIDPPWPYQTKAKDYDPEGRVIAPPYQDMSIDDILNIKLPMADDCIVWLWTTNAFIHEALHCLTFWGLEYKVMLSWFKGRNENKIQRGIGHWLRGQTEHCLLAIKGTPKLYPYQSAGTAFFGINRGHSKKPVEFYELIESICPGRKLDWFSRKQREGWVGYGNQGE